MNTLLTIYVCFSILTLVTFFLVILQAVATIKIRYPDYRGKTTPKIAVILSTLKMIILSFIPLFNILMFWCFIYHTDEIINNVIEGVMKEE